MLTAERTFPFLAVIVSLLAWQSPEPLLGLTGAIVPLLTIIMFSMGLTLPSATSDVSGKSLSLSPSGSFYSLD